MDINNTKIEVYILTSLLSADDEDELNDNGDIKFTIIPTSNFSAEDIISFMIEISKKLPITFACALIKEAFMKLLRKKIKPEPNKLVVTIKKTEHEEIYEFVSDWPLSEESVDKLTESIAFRIKSEVNDNE